jgi:hypothetical protein
MRVRSCRLRKKRGGTRRDTMAKDVAAEEAWAFFMAASRFSSLRVRSRLVDATISPNPDASVLEGQG